MPPPEPNGDAPVPAEDVAAPSVQLDWQERYHALAERFAHAAEERFAAREELSRLRARSATQDALDALIKPYARNTFRFMCAYCGFVALALVLHGLPQIAFALSESVLQILVGSTAVTVIGLVGMVLTGVFVGARSR